MFRIDSTEDYPHLPLAPIVEAVIHWQARVERKWERESVRAEVARLLPNFPKIDDYREFELAFEAKLDEEANSPAFSRHGGWSGVRITSADAKYVAQLTRNGLIFSQLAPYDKWSTFESEARLVWRAFLQIAQPTEVQRLGVRFINRIDDITVENLKDCLREPPSLMADLRLKDFLYRSTFVVPGSNLGVTIVKMLQESRGSNSIDPGLIIDIDAFALVALPCDNSTMDEYLASMQKLKNHVFFNLLSQAMIKKLGAN